MFLEGSRQDEGKLLGYLFEEASLGIAVEDTEGNLLLTNRALCSMLGYSSEELCHMSCAQFGHPEDSQVDWALFQQLRTGAIDRYSLEKRYVKKDGTLVWGRLNVSILRNSEGPSLVFALVEDITERKQTDEALRKSEGELVEVQRLAGVGNWRWDTRTDTLIWSEELYRLTGLDPQLPPPSFKEHPNLFTAESWSGLRHAVEEALQNGASFELDMEIVRPDFSTKWVIARGEQMRDARGQVIGLRGTVQDITERKRAEEALSSVSRRLIEAQEQERAHIARELHDDWSQRMALLQIRLEQFEQDTVGLSSQAIQQLRQIAGVAAEVSSGIHNLSHQLHPSKLDTLGLVASLEGLCREFSGQHHLQVQFVHRDIPVQIPKDVTLCLFRIVQEALHNVVKHSRAAEAKVELSGHGDGIDLCVSDSGAGFSPESAQGVSGLGLVSMRERLWLVAGQLSVESEPSHGTQIRVRIPPRGVTNAPVTSEGKAHQAGA
jgi:PAS domain S-box-containing protein